MWQKKEPEAGEGVSVAQGGGTACRPQICSFKMLCKLLDRNVKGEVSYLGQNVTFLTDRRKDLFVSVRPWWAGSIANKSVVSLS